MAEIINLRLARKAKARADAAKNAAHNRAAFGRSKGAKSSDLAERERAEKRLDGARREVDE